MVEKEKNGIMKFKSNIFDTYFYTGFGAIESVLYRFIDSLDFSELYKLKKINFLDIGFGMGFISCVFIDMLRENGYKGKITANGLEIDRKILPVISQLNPGLKSYPLIQKLITSPKGDDLFEVKEDNVRLSLRIGDATELVKTVGKKYDIIFLDPFESKVNPQLWSKTFLNDIKNLMTPESKLIVNPIQETMEDSLADLGYTIVRGKSIKNYRPAIVGSIVE
jgi:chorismate dehydratase